MRREVFTREDLIAILSAIALTVAATSRGESPHDAAYRRGVTVTLAAFATALHIAPGQISALLQAAQLPRLQEPR